jgi:hypothetical protein
MIRGVHTMFYTSQAEELRAFLRDWLIFDMPPALAGKATLPRGVLSH